MKGLHWYRVELDAEGHVVTCALVAEPLEDSRHVFYIPAVDAAAANKEAFNAYYRQRQRDKRAIFRKQGGCNQCGRPRAPGYLRCQPCMDQKAESRERRAKRERGEYVPPIDKAATQAKRRASERDELRLAVLEEVRAWWREAGNHWKFVARLRAEIEKLSPKRDSNIRRSA